MNIPTIPVQTKPFLWGAAMGAVVLAIVGFNWGGWMTGSAAEKVAAERTDTAIVTAFTPVCVDQFQRNTNASANLAELKEIDRSWDQRNYVSEGGWATIPGASSGANRKLAASCAEQLAETTL